MQAVSASPETDARRAAMAVCAEAQAAELAAALVRFGELPAVREIRPAETGLVMLRGRMGGDGAPFNLGEATVTRAAVEIGSGRTGFAYHLGRDGAKARAAAILDALWQEPDSRDAVEAALAPVRERLAAQAEREARRVAATRVDFFTLVRGGD